MCDSAHALSIIILNLSSEKNLPRVKKVNEFRRGIVSRFIRTVIGSDQKCILLVQNCPSQSSALEQQSYKRKSTNLKSTGLVEKVRLQVDTGGGYQTHLRIKWYCASEHKTAECGIC